MDIRDQFSKETKSTRGTKPKVWGARSCTPSIAVLEKRFSTDDGRPSGRPTGMITSMKDFGAGNIVIWEKIQPMFV